MARLRKEFKKREIYFLLIPVYFTFFVFFINFKDFEIIIFEKLNEKEFQVSVEKIVSVKSLYGAGRGSISIYIKKEGRKKLVLYSFIGNAIVPNKYAEMDSVSVLHSPKVNSYVFLYEPDIIQKRFFYLIFQFLYCILGIIFIYFVRKQHRIVKQLAPYGVDKHFNPLPKPEEKFNYNKYEKDCVRSGSSFFTRP